MLFNIFSPSHHSEIAFIQVIEDIHIAKSKRHFLDFIFDFLAILDTVDFYTFLKSLSSLD